MLVWGVGVRYNIGLFLDGLAGAIAGAVYRRPGVCAIAPGNRIPADSFRSADSALMMWRTASLNKVEEIFTVHSFNVSLPRPSVAVASAALLGGTGTSPDRSAKARQRLGQDPVTFLPRDPSDMTWLAEQHRPRKGRIDCSRDCQGGFHFLAVRADARCWLRVTALLRSGPARRSTRWLPQASTSRPESPDVSENVTLVMTENVSEFPHVQFPSKLGWDASVAAGPVGAGAKSDVACRPGGRLQPRQGFLMAASISTALCIFTVQLTGTRLSSAGSLAAGHPASG